MSVLQLAGQEHVESQQDDSSRPMLVQKADATQDSTKKVQLGTEQIFCDTKTAPPTGLHLKQDLHLPGLRKPLPMDVVADVRQCYACVKPSLQPHYLQ